MENLSTAGSNPLSNILALLPEAKKTKTGYVAKCPAHADTEASLSIKEGADGQALIHCFAGCDPEDITDALGLKMSDLFPAGGGGRHYTRKTRATVQHARKAVDSKGKDCCKGESNTVQQCNGITLAEYAEAKKLPIDFLRSLSVSDMSYIGAPAIRIPYHKQDGTEGSIRIRKALNKDPNADNRFAWRKGDKSCLYGLERKYAENYRIVVEGESDAQTCWYHGFPAYGLPGASTWRDDRDAATFDGCDTIYVIKEPDKGGETLTDSLRQSSIKDRVKVISLNGFKDPSDLHIADPGNFEQNFRRAMEQAVPLTDIEKAEAEIRKAEAWACCHALAEQSDILKVYIETVRAMGVAGEDRILKLLYLALVSRYLQRPVSMAVKGPSSGGKSFSVETALSFFPEHAYYALTSMSEHALAYSEESLIHRMLVIYEAAGMAGDLASYLIRSLLSEGRIRYETIIKGKDGLESKLIDREGPTGCILTTTATQLHPENETRLLSVTVLDTPEQTRAIFRAIAQDKVLEKPDLSQWHALQEWLDHADHIVIIPFAEVLADLIPPIAVRLRRDFTMILNLIKSHALLHQATREKDEQGRIIATPQDYSVIRELIVDSVSDGVGATVSQTARETVQAVKKIISDGNPSATLQQCATALNLDKSATSRRIKVCLKKGYLVNVQNQRGKPMQLVIGEPLPEDLEILPSPEKLGCCTVASQIEGVSIPPPPYDEIENDPAYIDGMNRYLSKGDTREEAEAKVREILRQRDEWRQKKLSENEDTHF